MSIIFAVFERGFFQMKKSSDWVMTQTWEHLMFMHWEQAPDKIKALIPSELELDLYDGKAWITILPFKVTHQRFHWFPEIPLLNTYLELNVRTYVKFKGKVGVYFFTLDANHPLTVLGTKAMSLPYQLSKMEMLEENNEILFKSRRLFEYGKFSARYESASQPKQLEPGSLDYWLLERYCLFTKWGNLLLRGDIRHEKWEVSEVNYRIRENEVAPFLLTTDPLLLHYAAKKQVIIFPLRKA